MSDDLEFDLEVVENDELDGLSADGTSSSGNQPRSVREHAGERATESTDPRMKKAEDSSTSSASPESNLDDSRSASSEIDSFRFGDVPDDWGVSLVGEIAKGEKGLVDGDWVESKDMDEDGDIQLVQLGHIGGGQLKGQPDRFVNEEFAEEENCTVLSEGDLLISRMQEPILRSCLLPDFDRESIMAVDIARLREKDDWNRIFLKYLFNSRPVWKQGIAWASGTTRKRISRKNIEKIRLQKPPLPEQRKIASVLYTVDQAIQKTEAIIEQAKRVKRGVIQKVLKGEAIDGDTKVEKFRIGPKLRRLPSNWQVRPLGEIAEVSGGKRLPKDHSYADKRTDYPYLRVTDMKGGSIDPEELEYLRAETYQEISKYTISSDDVYISIAGTIGVAGVIPEELDGANLTENAAKIHGLKSVNRDYLALYLQSKLGQDEIFRMTVGSSQPKLSLFRIKLIDVVLPPVDVQEEIASAVEGFRDKIASEQKTVSRLNTLKKGLMQDLLTGEIRTVDKAIDVLDEVKAHG